MARDEDIFTVFEGEDDDMFAREQKGVVDLANPHFAKVPSLAMLDELAGVCTSQLLLELNGCYACTASMASRAFMLRTIHLWFALAYC